MNSLFKKIIVWALRAEAKAVLRKYKPRIVAITGSVGKTSTKDAIYAALARQFRVRKSEKSFNSEIGLPLTILGVGNAWHNPLRWLQNLVDGVLLLIFDTEYPEWLVLEVGADRPGDISLLKSWLPVDVAVITRLPEVPVHVEFFASVEAVVEEKASLLDAVKKGGAILLYADDERTRKLEHRLPAPDAKILLFGFGDGSHIRGENFELLRESDGTVIGMQGTIKREEVSAPIALAGAVGAHAFLPLIAAVAVGEALGVGLAECIEGLRGYEPPPGRMRLIAGLKGSLIVDDTYNSSPAAVHAALETLSLIVGRAPLDGGISQGRRIAALGDMLELGRHSVDEHRKAGVEAAKHCDVLVTVGFRARDIAQAAREQGVAAENILQFDDSQRAGAELQNLLQPGDCVLVKGSQSIRMERVVEEIMLNPEQAEKLLVRQDREWKRR